MEKFLEKKQETIKDSESIDIFFKPPTGNETPEEILEIAATVPKETIQDQTFQIWLVETVLKNIHRTDFEANDTSGWASVLSSLKDRGVTNLAENAKSLVSEECNQNIIAGNFKTTLRVKDLFETAFTDETFLDATNLADNVIQGLLKQRRTLRSDYWLDSLLLVRSLDPIMQSPSVIERLYTSCVKEFLCTRSKHLLIYHIEILKHEYPEIIEVLKSDRSVLSLVLRAYEEGWFRIKNSFSFESLFDISVAETGLLERAQESIEGKMLTSLDGALRLKEILGVTDLPIKGEASSETFRKGLLGWILHEVDTLDDTFFEKLQAYCSGFGAQGEDLVVDYDLIKVILDKLTLTFATNWDQSEVDRVLYLNERIERFAAAIGADTSAKEVLFINTGFYIQEKGLIAEGAHIHRLHDISFKEAGSIESEERGEDLMNERLRSLITNRIEGTTLRGRRRSNLMFDLEAIATENNLSPEFIAEETIVLLLQNSDEMIYVLNTIFEQVTSQEGEILPVFDAICRLFRDRNDFRTQLQQGAIDQFEETNSHLEVVPFFTVGIFDETEKFLPRMKSAAVTEYLSGIENGHLNEDVKEFFEIAEEDISLEHLREAVEKGIVKKILSGNEDPQQTPFLYTERPRYTTKEVREFATHFGFGGESLENIERAAMVTLLKKSTFIQFQNNVAAYGLPETIYEDVVFREAALDRVIADITKGKTSEMAAFMDAFELRNERQILEDAVYKVWHLDREPKIFQKILTAGLPDWLISPNLLKRVVERAVLLRADVEGDFQAAVIANEQASPVIDAVLTRTADIFGEYAGWSHYEVVSQLLSSDKNIDVPAELEVLGVTKKGESGVDQLRAGIREFQNRIISEAVSAEELEENELLADIYMQKTRVGVTQWGRQTKEVMIETLRRSKKYVTENKEAGLSPKYQPSEVLGIGTVREQKHFEFDKDFLERYKTIAQSLFNAVENSDPYKKPLTKLVEKMNVDRTILIAELEEKLREPVSDSLQDRARKEADRSGRDIEEVIADLQERRREQLMQSISELQDINLRSLHDVQNNFRVLAKYKEFDDLLRETMFTFALLQREHRERVNELRDDVLYEFRPSEETISKILDFVDHIVNQEVMDKYFTDKKAAQDFRRINSVVALEKQLSKMTQDVSDKKMPVKFIPTRGALLELSGQIADACWANKYDLVAAHFPNITAVTMVGNPGEQREKIIGSALLIEAESREGDPVLIIRGLNPLENIINKLDVSDFYDQFTAWAQEQADRMGRQLCIVIDNHSGGSATNRPKLFQFLSNLKNGLDQVVLRSEENTTFNEYNIIRDTWFV